MLRIAAPLLAAAIVMAAPQARAEVYGAQSFTLANGMQVVLIPNHRAPVVSHMVFYKVGSADEPAGKSGIAHFLEHLMFKGTKKYPEGAMTEIVARNGGNQNAFTTADYTGYYQNIAVDRLPLMMDMESDRMRNLVLSEKDIATEREVIIEERRMRTDNSPSGLLGERMSATLWMTNKYSIPVIGWLEEMRGLNLEDNLGIYRQYYSPQNAILVVAGDITLDKLKPLAEKYYGPIPKADNFKPRERSTFLYDKADSRVTLHHERVTQPSWSRQIIAPSYNVGDRTDVHALEVFSEIIGGGSTTKLYRKLVVEQQVAAAFGAGYDTDAVSYGSFYVSMTPSPGVSIEQAEAAYEKALAELLANGITEADVQQAKNRFAARLAFAKDSPMSAARAVGTSLASGIKLEDIENWPEAVNKVTLAQVQAAARRLFADNSSVTGILLPPEQTAGGPTP